MKVICMSFDGEFQTDRPSFDSTSDAWDYANNLGSKWYFYPFVFVVSESGKTVIDSADGLGFFNGRRVSTVARVIREAAAKPENQKIGLDEFVSVLRNG